MADSLSGIVERITYHNEENGYTVAQLTPDGKDYTIPIIGNMLGINVGESVRVFGTWGNHPQYGRQFKVESYKTVLPATITGIKKYLGSGLIKGVGPVTAERIVKKFGLRTLDVLEEDPDSLHQVLGVGPKRVRLIKKAWTEQKQIEEVMLFLQANSVSTGLAVKIYKAYGDASIGVVKNDPYRLAKDIFGIGFLTADKIARNLGLSESSPTRIEAGVSYVLSQQADEGHVYSPQHELVAESIKLLNVEPGLVQESIQRLAQEEAVHCEPLQYEIADEEEGPPRPYEVSEEQAVYLTPFYYSEVGVANRIRRLIGTPEGADKAVPGARMVVFAGLNWERLFADLEREGGVALAPQQQEAVITALTHPFTVMTGGPGTGKTTSVRALIKLLEKYGRTYLLAAPTGRAAKRLSEATGRPAKTIHRLLEIAPGNGFQFTRNQDNPLEADMLIIDEASMLDLVLANNLLKAVPPGAHVLFVGDIDQLPSVGAGNVLKDIMAADIAAVVRLETIFRQAPGSLIIANAHRINQGLMPLFSRDATDFFWFKAEEPEAAAALIVDLVQNRIPARFKLRPEAIQVLSPMHRGEAGVASLNERLQASLNPPAPNQPERRVGGRVFRLGDRLMQIRNNYDKDVYNGDMGRLIGLDVEEQVASVEIDGRPVEYDFTELDELIHAYAVSVHKSQGSEFPAVVIPLLTQHYMMLQRNLIYTGVTRAQKLVVLVGDKRALAMAIKNNRITQRHTALAERLRGEKGDEGRRTKDERRSATLYQV